MEEKKKEYIVSKDLLNILWMLSEFVTKIGEIEEKIGPIPEWGEYLTSMLPELSEKLERNSETAAKVGIISLNFFSILPMFANFENLSPKKKKELGKKIGEIADLLEELR